VLPDAPECGTLALTHDPEVDSAALRRHLGIEPVGPVPDVVCLLENRGILYIELEAMGEHFSGMNGFADGRPYIAVNASMNPERKRSTIMHEIAHLMFDWDDIQGKQQEKHATAVSGAFLFPAADAVRELGIRRSAITRDMEIVAREYGVSMMLLAMRAHLVGIVNDSSYVSFCKLASRAGWRKNEPSRIEAEHPGLFEQLVYRAVCEDDISIQHGAELLGRSFDEVAYECGLCGE